MRPGGSETAARSAVRVSRLRQVVARHAPSTSSHGQPVERPPAIPAADATAPKARTSPALRASIRRGRQIATMATAMSADDDTVIDMSRA